MATTNHSNSNGAGHGGSGSATGNPSSPSSALLPVGHNGEPSGVGGTGGGGGAAMDLFFPMASQPDIVRAFQKDAYYSRMLTEQYFEVVSRLFGTRLATRLQPELKLCSEFTYFVLTTLRGKQTLGEEYCDLVQIKSFNNLPPSLLSRTWLLIWQVFIPYAYDKLLAKVSIWSSTSALRSNSGVLSKISQLSLPQLKDCQASLQRFHLALFYLHGDFYEFAKRIAAVKYIFNRRLDEARPQYGILGVLILIQLLVSLLQFLRERAGLILALATNSHIPQQDALSDIRDGEIEEAEEELISSKSCSLCLEPRKITTATPCGHLFCWNCIHESCVIKRECPVCRHSIEMSRLVRLHHYT